MHHSKQNHERGSALVVALMMLLALGFVGASLVLTAGSDLKVAGQGRQAIQAQFAAEAGVQEALHRLSLAAGTNVTANGVTFDAAIRDPNVPLDPNWERRIYVPTGTTPSSGDPSVSYTPTVQTVAQALDYARSSGVLTIQHKWVDRDNDNVREAGELVLYDAQKVPPENFVSGSPVEVVEVAGFRGDSRRRLRVETTRFPFSPNVIAAISSDRGVDVRGNVSICGHNHRATTPVNTDLSSGPCSPNWDEAEGHLPAITTSGDPVDRRGSSDLLGSPTAMDTSSTNPFYPLAEALGVTQDVVDQILANADHTDTDADPLDGVTYVQGNARCNNTTGQGLLYVTGDLDVSGNFVWKGLIYVEGDLKLTGTPWILGGIMVRGRSDYAFSGGSPAVLYSRDMLRVALQSAFSYVVLSWKEL